MDHGKITGELILLTGVSGSGKTTLGEKLALQLNIPYLDADAFHPKENIEKMKSGLPLDDGDRAPWLTRLNQQMRHMLRDESSRLVLGCSALKRKYRQALLDGLPNAHCFVLHAPINVLQRRLEQRPNHFFPVSLLASQLSTFEPSKDVTNIDTSRPLEVCMKEILLAILNNNGTACPR